MRVSEDESVVHSGFAVRVYREAGYCSVIVQLLETLGHCLCLSTVCITQQTLLRQ